MKNRLMTMLGFTKKSGNLLSGEGITLEHIKRNHVKVVILANDASENTAKRIKDKASYRGIPIIELLSREELGQAIGVRERVVVAIANPKFAESILVIVGGNRHGEN